MTALRFTSDTQSLATFYDRPEPRGLTRDWLLATAAVGLLFGAAGLYLANQKFTLHVETRPAEPTVTVQMDPEIRPEVPPIPPKPEVVHVRQGVDNLIRNDLTPIPLAPTDMPPLDATPLEAPTSTLPERPPTPPPPPAPRTIRNPAWISMPTAEQLNRLYPDRAQRMEMGGTAVLTCLVTASGAMADCAIAEETPKGWRFGDAAMAAARYFRISPKMIDGMPVEGARVRIPIVFNLSG